MVNALILSILPRRDHELAEFSANIAAAVELGRASSSTIFYQSCPRLLRADVGPKKIRVSTAISIAGSIASAHAGIMPSALASARPKRGVTATSLLLPVASGLIIGSMPLVIIAVVWRFNSESSFLTERVIMLLWWSSNIVLGLMMSFLDVIEVMVCLVWLPLFVIMKSPKTVVHGVLLNHVLAIL